TALSLGMQLLRSEVREFLNNCSSILIDANVKTRIVENENGPSLCLNDGPVWLDSERLYRQWLDDEQEFPTLLVEQANRAHSQQNRSKTHSVILVSFGSKKIAVLQIVRELLEIGVKGAMEIVESAPVTLKEGLRLAEAEKLKQQLEAAGAEAEIVN